MAHNHLLGAIFKVGPGITAATALPVVDVFLRPLPKQELDQGKRLLGRFKLRHRF